MSNRYAIGLDLHGTLLDDRWQIRDDLRAPLLEAIEGVRTFTEIYICSGNDLTFLRKHVPEEVLNRTDGYIMETGCVICDRSVESVLVPRDTISDMRELENRLRHYSFESVKYFATRVATISMFTKTETGGDDPAALYPPVCSFIEENGFSDRVYVTHSDVAVDIIPRGFNKYTGLSQVAGESVIIGIADSMNDIHLITDSDLAFIPANASERLIAAMQRSGREIKGLSDIGRTDDRCIYRSGYSHTEAVIDILHNLLVQYFAEQSGTVGDDAVDTESDE